MVPEGHSEGDEITCLATLKLEAGNKACLTHVDDQPLAGYEDDDEDDSKMTYPQAAAKAMDAGQGGY